MEYLNEREQLVKAGLRLLHEGLVSRTWGNISVKVNDSEMVVTPSGKFYDEVTPNDMVLVNFKTNEYKSEIKPFSEFKMHSGIYND